VFAKHCALARKLHLPIVIHSRADFASTYEVLQDYTDCTIYFHCWGYGVEQLQQLQHTFPNLFIGFCGNVTFKKAQELRDVLAIMRLDQLVLETDAPYLAPVPHRGKQNEPALIVDLYQFVAEELVVSPEVLCAQLENNFERLYQLRS